MNNKFKRFNKILMMTVAILLCFVLISTSVVSGIFAKYVITRSAGATVSLKKFGVTLTVTGMNDTTKKISTKVDKTDANGNSVEITVSGVSLAPKESITDVVKFEIAEATGGSNVPKVKLKIKVDVSDITAFSVPANTIDSVSAGNYLPFSFTAKCGTSSSVTSQEIAAAWATSADDAETKICAGLKSKYTFTDTSGEADTVEKIILDRDNTSNKISSISTKYLSFGFTCWASGGTTPTNADLIQTYLSEKTTAPTLTIKYIVSLEQVV